MVTQIERCGTNRFDSAIRFIRKTYSETTADRQEKSVQNKI